jgi:fibronectin type 3 domain-containing protein
LQVTIDGRKLELPGALSPPIRIHAVNVFPPEVPRRLVAVAAPSQNGAPPSIDLSWLPDAETNVAGYIVYRRQDGGSWQRISPAQPVVGPAFRDTHVEPGHTYEYAVSAVGRDGLESVRSATTQETVPKP